MVEVISEESSRERWEEMKKLWEIEHRPGYLVVGNKTYTVYRLGGNRLEFRADKDDRGFYESTSFQQ